MKKGMTMTSVLTALLVSLVIVGIAWILLNRFAFESPNDALTDVTSCSKALGALTLGQGQCLADKNCEGRAGWQEALITGGCEEPTPHCCYISRDNIHEYFTPGSVIVTYNNDDYLLTPTDRTLGRDLHAMEDQTTVNRNRITANKESGIAIYYRPHMGAGDKPADQTCALTVNTAGGQKRIASIENCYGEASATKNNWVLLWAGNGQAFQDAIGDGKGKGQPKVGYGFTMTATPTQGAAVVKSYDAALKVVS